MYQDCFVHGPTIDIHMLAKLPALLSVLLMTPLYTALAASVDSINQLIVFGDSLSDNGNASILTKGAQPGPNYATRNYTGTLFPVGYFTDGTNTTPSTSGPTGLWIDQFAAKLNNVADPIPFAIGGTNFAIGSAKTGSSSAIDIGNQITAFTTTHLTGAPSDALYTLWGGADDVDHGLSPITAANNIYQYILTLSGEGARHFLWTNLPLLGETPAGLASGSSAALNAASIAFNTQWGTDVSKLHSQGLDVVGVDVGTLFAGIATDPSAYGFTNVTSPAQGLSGVNPNQYLFWDDLHPTTAGHALIADLAFRDLRAVPEPLGIGLSLVGFCGILALRRSVRRRAPFTSGS